MERFAIVRSADGIVLAGALDEATGAVLLSTVRATGGDVAVDCSGITEVDAGGFAALLASPQCAPGVRLVNPSAALAAFAREVGPPDIFDT